MQCAFNPHDKLDEISIVFAYNYYGLLSGGAERLKDLEPLYTGQSVRGQGGGKGGAGVTKEGAGVQGLG